MILFHYNHVGLTFIDEAGNVEIRNFFKITAL